MVPRTGLEPAMPATSTQCVYQFRHLGSKQDKYFTMKPYFKLNFPFPSNKLLAPTFNLPRTEYDDVNPYIPVEKDVHGNALNCATHNKWIHRFNGPTSGQEYVPIHDVLSKELVDFMASLNIDIGCIFIFYACPGSEPGGIHADWGNVTQGKDANFAINWTIGGVNEDGKEDHHMIWYKPRSDQLDEKGWPIDATPAALAYPIPTWRKNKVIEIARYSIVEPTLVRTDIPHNAENYSTTPRWCFSIRTNLVLPDWPSIVNVFKDYISE